MSLKYIPSGPVNHNPALIQKMTSTEDTTIHYLTQCCPSLLTHTCVTRPRWVKNPRTKYFSKIPYRTLIQVRYRKVHTVTNIQYIPRNMHTVLLCFALLWLCNRSKWIHMKYLSIFIRVALLALGQSLDCHSASEVSLMDMGKSVNV